MSLGLLLGLLAAAQSWSQDGPADGAADDYIPALSLVPDTAAGVARIPHVPVFCEAWKTTTLGSLLEDAAMKPFVDFQRERSQQQATTLGVNVGVRPRDIYEVASGEVVVAWLPFSDPRRPYALALIADIRGNQNATGKVIDQVDRDLRAGGATVKVKKFGDESISIYTLPTVPGQIKIDEVAITFNADRLIAADRESVVTSMLESVAGTDETPKLIDSADYQTLQEQIGLSDDAAAASGSAAAGEAATAPPAIRWFARPLAMGRIIKEAANIDRGRQVDVLKLLERQGFDAITAVGGQLTIGQGDFDLLHKGFVLAPPIPGEPDRYRLAARMLRPLNVASPPVPTWVSPAIASFTRLSWDLSDAFWHVESLVNDAFGEEIFRDILDGIRDDEDGPRIDIAEEVIPNLGDHVLILTDNLMPVEPRSERMLVAIEIRDVEALRAAVRQAMEVEPDALILPAPVDGVEVYRVLRTDDIDDFEAELFNDLGLGDNFEADAPPPLLNQWAIAVIAADEVAGAEGKAGGYLMFSSHPELLLETIERFGKPVDSLGELPEIEQVRAQLRSVGGDEQFFVRMARSHLTFRAKYSLIREGRLRDSDSILATLFRRIFINKNGDAPPLGTDKLPPFEEVQKYFRPAGGISHATDLGFTLDGFLLK